MKTINTIVTPQDYTASLFASIVTGVLFRNAEATAQFYAGPVGDAPKTDAGIRAEAQFNNLNAPEYHSTLFAATIKALTGETVRSFSPTGSINWKVGMVVTPVKPAHRERSDDGYTIGQNYFVTNETYRLARGADKLENGLKDSVGPMSTYNDEWQLVTDQAQIEALVTLLIEKLGIKFTDGVLTDKGSGKSLADVLSRFTE